MVAPGQVQEEDEGSKMSNELSGVAFGGFSKWVFEFFFFFLGGGFGVF